MKAIQIALSMAVLGSTFIGVSEAQTQNFSDHFPLTYGNSWKYVNPANPASDFWYWDLLGTHTFGGVDCWKLGTDDCNCWYVANDGTSFKWLGYADGCVDHDFVPDLEIGVFADGAWMQVGTGNEYILLRFWENLNPADKPDYGVDPNLQGVVVMAWYDDDSGYPPNSENLAMEYGLSSHPPGAVTDLEWYQSGIGPIGYTDVDAASGVLGPWYDVVRGAYAVFRNAGSNPASYTLSGRPVLGTTITATIDLASTGHSLAMLVGYTTPLTLVLGGGQAVLVNIVDPYGELLMLAPLGGPLAAYSLMIPTDISFVGFYLATQAIHIGGVQPFALSNAQDLFLGF